MELLDLLKPEVKEAFEKWLDVFAHDLEQTGAALSWFTHTQLELIFVTVMKEREDAAEEARELAERQGE